MLTPAPILLARKGYDLVSQERWCGISPRGSLSCGADLAIAHTEVMTYLMKYRVSHLLFDGVGIFPEHPDNGPCKYNDFIG